MNTKKIKEFREKWETLKHGRHDQSSHGRKRVPQMAEYEVGDSTPYAGGKNNFLKLSTGRAMNNLPSNEKATREVLRSMVNSITANDLGKGDVNNVLLRLGRGKVNEGKAIMDLINSGIRNPIVNKLLSTAKNSRSKLTDNFFNSVSDMNMDEFEIRLDKKANES